MGLLENMYVFFAKLHPTGELSPATWKFPRLVRAPPPLPLSLLHAATRAASSLCSLLLSSGLLALCTELIQLLLTCQSNHICQYLTRHQRGKPRRCRPVHATSCISLPHSCNHDTACTVITPTTVYRNLTTKVTI